MKTAPWILCCILFAVILLQQMCKGKTATDTVPKSDYEAQKKTTADTVKYFNQIIKADDAAIGLAVSHAEQSAERARASEDKVTESQGVIARLNAKIDAAKKEKPDSSWISVSPRYVDGCDSLQLTTKKPEGMLTHLNKQNDSLVASKQNEIATRDKALTNRMNFNSALQKQLDSCQGKLKEKEQPIEKKNQWFGVIGLIGNQINPIGGGEAGILLINKRGVMYGAKAEVLGGRVWYGVKTGFKLFK
jgi:hypothetical protein